MGKIQIGHIVNPVFVQGDSDLVIAQPITFETMRRAVDYAKGTVDVELLAAFYAEDVPVVPIDFSETSNLSRSVMDFGAFQKPRKLPLLRDILDRLYGASSADYLIYSNIDIAVMPYFYSTIAALISEGHDALTINRRTVSKQYGSPTELSLMYAEAGRSHPGYDCFVFWRKLRPLLDVGNVCVGANYVGLVMMLNLYRAASRFRLIEDAHLTFHVGDDRTWKNPGVSDYSEYNRREARRVIAQLEDKHGAFGEDTPGWSCRAVGALKSDTHGPSRSYKSWPGRLRRVFTNTK
jgi:hypothetical protein